MSTTNTANSNQFEAIKGKVVAFIKEEFNKKNQETTDTKSSSNNDTASSTNNNKDQLNFLLERVNSFMNKQEGNKKQESRGETQTEGAKTTDQTEQDLQTKLTSFVKSLSTATSGNGNNQSSDQSSNTTTKASNNISQVQDKDSIVDIMDKLKTAFGTLNNSQQETTSKSTTNNGESTAATKGEKTPLDEFFGFMEGLMNEHNNKTKSTINTEGTSPKDSALKFCGAFGLF